MAEPIKISTSNLVKNGKVDVDGNIWGIVLPGAGTELRISQMQKEATLYEARLLSVEKKINAGSATDEDLDNYEQYIEKSRQSERFFYDMMLGVFQDGSKDNASVKKWLDETPTLYIMQAFEDVKKQATDSGRTDTPSSTQ
ncbi:MAG TPA: hypothetical protein VD794_16345 [Flavisolibacter sp.]|nr:hypothetical protein [Flavisolibacter sp.]